MERREGMRLEAVTDPVLTFQPSETQLEVVMSTSYIYCVLGIQRLWKWGAELDRKEVLLNRVSMER
eukprot:scaffold473_cov132-Cylindrotheca_fusiformis.AAC.17